MWPWTNQTLAPTDLWISHWHVDSHGTNDTDDVCYHYSCRRPLGKTNPFWTGLITNLDLINHNPDLRRKTKVQLKTYTEHIFCILLLAQINSNTLELGLQLTIILAINDYRLLTLIIYFTNHKQISWLTRRILVLNLHSLLLEMTHLWSSNVQDEESTFIFHSVFYVSI